MSSDGSILAGNIMWKGVWMSSDGGTTWSQVLAVEQEFKSLAMSADGTKMAALSLDYRRTIWLSSDGGSSWNEAKVDFEADSIAMSADGIRMAAAVSNGFQGTLWTSEDGGSTWAEIASPGLPAREPWVHVAMSPDGSKILAHIDSGDVWLISRSCISSAVTPAVLVIILLRHFC